MIASIPGRRRRRLVDRPSSATRRRQGARPSTRSTLPNSCFRVNSYGALAIDPGTSDLYYVWDDNRNGTPGVLKPNWFRSSVYGTQDPFSTDPVMDVDVFIAKSSDGGQT